MRAPRQRSDDRPRARRDGTAVVIACSSALIVDLLIADLTPWAGSARIDHMTM
jgi:hypothetical protein